MAREVIDGAFNDQKYREAPVRMLWLLKESLEYEQKSQADLLNDAIKKGKLGDTWTTIAYVAYAVIHGWEDGNFVKWEEIPSVEKGVGEILNQVAIVNVNKEPNATKNGISVNASIKRAYSENADSIENQILKLNPKIVVFGYPEALGGIVDDVFQRLTGQTYEIDKQFGTFAATVRDNRLFIWAYHPSIYRSEENGHLSKYRYYESFIESVQLFRQKVVSC